MASIGSEVGKMWGEDILVSALVLADALELFPNLDS